MTQAIKPRRRAVPRDQFSHAYFPRDAFDELVECTHWICARKGDGFLALYSQHPYRWLQDQAEQTVELRVDAPDNVWVCGMGDRARWGSFDAFVRAVGDAEIRCQGLEVRYASPSLGVVRFGWKGDFEVALARATH